LTAATRICCNRVMPKPANGCIIRYRDIRKQNYKYKLHEPYQYRTPIQPPRRIAEPSEFVVLETNGLLHLKANYAWDGASGPAVDTPDFMRASLVHDALYQLMRLGLLSASEHRLAADDVMLALCLEDGMRPMRAKRVYQFVRWFGEQRAMAQLTSEVICAP
jgi:hypothetical protein